MRAQVIRVVIAGGKHVGAEQHAPLDFLPEAFAAAFRENVDRVRRARAPARVADAVVTREVGRGFRHRDNVIRRDRQIDGRQGNFADFAALRLEPRGGFFHDLVDFGIAAEKFLRQADFPFFRGSGKLRKRRRARAGKRGGVVRVRRGDDVEQRGGVGDAARHRSDLLQRRGKRRRAVAGNRAVSRLEAHGAAEARRLADGAARVRPERERRQACGDGGGAPAGRSAGNAVRVPRIRRFRESGIFRRRAHRELVHVESAENRRSRFFQILDDGRVVGRNEIFENLRRAGQGLAVHCDIVLDGDGNAVERTARRSRGAARVGGVRLRERVVFVDGEKRAQFPVDLADAVELRLHQFPRGNFFLREHRGKFERSFEI